MSSYFADVRVGVPALLHPGRGDVWWFTSRGPAFRDDDGQIWVRDGEHWHVRAGSHVHERNGEVLIDWHTLGGENRSPVRRVDARWQHDRVRLPEGARVAVHLVASPDDDGVVWQSGPWIYRLGRCIAKAGRQFVVGPQSAVLLGVGEVYDRVCAPGRSEVRLGEALAADDHIRWSDDGMRVRGLVGSEAVTLDAVSGAVLQRVEGVPVSLRHTLRNGCIDADGDVVLKGIVEASIALDGDVLGGPGGVCWDLRTGRRRFDEPVLLLGCAVPCGARWVTVDWESGDGRVIDPVTGEVLGTFHLELAEDDLVDVGVHRDGKAIVRTVLGELWCVDPQTSEVERGSDWPGPPALPCHPAATWTEDGRLVYSGIS